MAKRFTDSEKWRKPWFRALSRDARTVWIYLTDNCDHAGIWPAAFDLLEGDTGISVDSRALEDWFGSKLVDLGDDKYFIPSFIEFQYGELKSDSRPHMSVIKVLTKYAIDPFSLTLSKQYPKGIHTLKDKEQDKDQAKEKEKDPAKIGALEDLHDAIPIITREQWARKYPDPSWLIDQVERCFEFHWADPASRPQTPGQWMKKLASWLQRGWDQRREVLKKASGSPECGIADV